MPIFYLSLYRILSTDKKAKKKSIFDFFIVCAFFIMFYHKTKVVMMQILIEQTLLINCLQNILILNLTSLLAKQRAKFIFLISLFAGAFALILPIFNLNGIFKMLIQIPVSAIIVSLAFKYDSFKKFLFILFSFYIFTFLLGGACFAFKESFGDFPLFIVSVISLVIYLLTKFVLFYHNRLLRIKSFTYKVTIKANGQEINEQGYLDSGNILIDNITNSPIVLINFDVFSQIYKDISLFSVISKNIDKSVNCGHYLQVNSIGSGKKILVFIGDELILNDCQVFKNPVFGLSFSGFEKSFNAKVLLNSQMVFGG